MSFMALSEKDDITGLDENVLYAVLCYLFVLVFVAILMKKNDPFVNFHAKQGLVLLAGLIISVIAAIWLPAVGNTLVLIVLLLDVVGLVQALLGRRWKIPGVGTLAQKFTL